MSRPSTDFDGERLGLTVLEIQVAMVVFAITLTGLYPLVLMQSRQLRKMETWIQPQKTYYLVPSTDEWARKLGAVAHTQTQDPGTLPTPPVTVIDNNENGYAETGSGWGAETQKKAYKGNHRWHASGTGSNTASWQFTGLQAGWYDIQITWDEGGNRATNAPFKVYYGGVLKETYSVNQKLAPKGITYDGSTWQSLCKLPFGTGNIQIVLSDNANGRVIADGVHLVPIRNTVHVLSLLRSLGNEEVAAHVSLTVVVPP